MKVLDLLGEAWDEFIKLTIVHDMDKSEFCAAIHKCQNIVLAREGERSIARATEKIAGPTLEQQASWKGF